MKKAFYIILSAIQAIVIFAVFILQYLSDKRMGVARYLIFKKHELEKSIFKPEYMNIYIIISIVVLIVILILAIYKLKMKAIGLIMLSFLLTFVLIYKPITTLKAFYFFIIALIIDLILEFIKIIV